MYMAVGSYVGDGVDNRAISGLGFQPDLVIVKARASNYCAFRTSEMAGDATLFFAYAAGGVYTNRIQSLDADGFTLGTGAEVNSAGVTYDWQAFYDDGAGDFVVGSYAGDGTDNRSISGLGFQPDLVCVKREGLWYGRWRTADVVTASAASFSTDADVADEIQALEADGFQLGTQQNVNGATYRFFAFKAVAGAIAHGSYSGNGADDRSISGLGFQPDLVWVKSASSGSRCAQRPSSLVGDSTEYFDTASPAANGIQALEADGFQVGTGQNASGQSYRWFAWKTVAPPPTGDRETTATQAATATETAAVVVQLASSDTAAATDASQFSLDGSDAGVASEAAVVSPLTDSVQIAATVDPRASDRVKVTATVLYSRLTSSVAISVAVVPQIADAITLQMRVMNQDFETAAAGAVIAPCSEITFL